MKIFIFFIECIRSVVFLFTGLCTFHFLEKKIIEKINGDLPLMTLLLVADLSLLFVIHRQFISNHKLTIRHRNSLLLLSFFIIIFVIRMS